MASAALSLAMRFLKIRPRSEQEIRSKLKLKGFDVQAIDETIDHLLKSQYLNDRAFADAWIRYRLARPFGFGRIIRELKEKGVDSQIIQDALEKVKPETQQTATALELALRKAERMQGIGPEKRKKRILDFLLRRGFAIDDAIRAIKSLNISHSRNPCLPAGKVLSGIQE